MTTRPNDEAEMNFRHLDQLHKPKGAIDLKDESSVLLRDWNRNQNR